MLLDLDTAEFEAADGVDRLLAKLTTMFGEVAMVKLGETLDTFFDDSKRKAHENLRDYVHRFEVNYGKLIENGESLSERAKVNRLLKGSGLSDREQRELLMSIGGEYDYARLKAAMSLFAHFYRGGPTGSGNSFSGNNGKGQFRKGFGKGNGKSGFKGFRPHTVHETDHVADEPGEDYYDQGLDYDEWVEDGDYQDLEEDWGNTYEANTFEDDTPPELQDAKHRMKLASQAKELLGGKMTDERRAQRLAEVKLRTKCAACGAVGHWRSDPQCPMRGKGPVKGKSKGKGGKPGGKSGKSHGKGKSGGPSVVNATEWDEQDQPDSPAQPASSSMAWYKGKRWGFGSPSEACLELIPVCWVYGDSQESPLAPIL